MSCSASGQPAHRALSNGAWAVRKVLLAECGLGRTGGCPAPVAKGFVFAPEDISEVRSEHEWRLLSLDADEPEFGVMRMVPQGLVGHLLHLPRLTRFHHVVEVLVPGFWSFLLLLEWISFIYIR